MNHLPVPSAFSRDILVFRGGKYPRQHGAKDSIVQANEFFVQCFVVQRNTAVPRFRREVVKHWTMVMISDDDF